MNYWIRNAKILVFFAGLWLILTASSALFTPRGNEKNAGMEEVEANGILGEKDNTVDIIVLGDSESYSSVIPMQIWKAAGYTSYISGTSGQTLDYSLVMLKRCFLKQKPKIVILETNTIYTEQSFRQVLLTKIGELFPVFRYHNRWKNLGNASFLTSTVYTYTDAGKGYRDSLTVVPGPDTNYMHPTEKIEGISVINQSQIEEIKDFCDENGAKLVLVSSPSSLNWNYSKHNGVQALATELGCDYLDLNLNSKELMIDWKMDTRDKGDHLNYYGARKVTSFLTDYLRSTGLLTDHREDPKYTGWEEASKRFDASRPAV